MTDPVLLDVRRIIREAIGASSLEAAAAIAGCSPRTLSRIVQGKPCQVTTLARVCRAFGRELRLQLAPKETATHCGTGTRAGSSYL